MTDFHHDNPIKATKKVHTCEQCGRAINVGSSAINGSGCFAGDFYNIYTHVECLAAAIDYATLNGLGGEDFPSFQHMDNGEHDHHEWLLENHPVVAARLNIVAEAVE